MSNNYLLKKFHLDQVDNSWRNFFQREEKKNYFFSLLEQVEEEYNWYKCWPSKENVFRLFREISWDKIKVVILGQDPYHLPGVADGIAFSTQKPNYVPASLKNIFLEFSQDLNCSRPVRGDLLPWVKEGVFLLNAALTVRDGQALSHMKLWEEFIYSLLTYLNEHNKKIIWVFWGQKARKIGEQCGISNLNNYVLTSTHPSPYSAESKGKDQKGYFIGSRPFSKTNQLLKNSQQEEINWLTILNSSFTTPK
jgi:uracil-DNA glycosylase